MIGRFLRNERGSVGVILALGSVAMFGAAAAGLDYTRMTNTRAQLTAAVDAAALAGAQVKSPDDPQALARQVFDANFRSVGAVSGFRAEPFKRGDDDGFRVEATANVQMTLSQIMGFSAMPVRSVSEVLAGIDQDLQVALVLDVTGSMQGQKIDALKSSARSMVNQLYDKLKRANQVKMAVVPFSEYVNVGMHNRNQPWIAVPPDETTTERVCRKQRDVTRTYNCRTEWRSGRSCNDGVCTDTGRNVQVCDRDYGPEYEKCGDQTRTVRWQGCVGSRNYPLNVRDENYLANRVPGVMNVTCPAQMEPLSTSRPTVLGAIDSLSAQGNTYIPSGLMWGWAALSRGEPFDEPGNGGREPKRFLVLMTDGENTLSPTYPYHRGNNRGTADSLTAELCVNIKRAGVEVFTIAFDVNSNNVKDLLRNCATTPDRFYDAGDPAQLAESFDSITRQLFSLRIAR